jgi:hypothetical protein
MKTAFKTGAWVSLLTGALHLVAQLASPEPEGLPQKLLFETMHRVRLDVGGIERTMAQICDGLSFSFSAAFFLVGAHALVLARHADPAVLRASAGLYAAFSAVLTVIGVFLFPIPPAVLTGVMTAAFATAALKSD